MQKVVSKVLFDYVTFVTAADYEIIHAKGGIKLHDMPENRPTTNLNHRFGPKVRLFGNARSEATGEDNCFHTIIPVIF